MVHCQLCPTIADNLLTWDGVVLIVSLMAEYDIDFAAIIRYKLHERSFGELSVLLFP